MRRFLGGRQPLCGTGVTSEMLVILKPTALSARTADSRPGPGPLIRTSMFLTPDSAASRPACSAATCAAKGVDLREPLKPLLPQVAQASALPWRSVIVTIVLLNDACTCAMPSATFLRTFLRTRVLAFAILWFASLVVRAGSRCFVLRGYGAHDLHCCLARPLTRARVRARALTADRKTRPVTLAAPRAQVDQPLDVHR